MAKKKFGKFLLFGAAAAAAAAGAYYYLQNKTPMSGDDLDEDDDFDDFSEDLDSDESSERTYVSIPIEGAEASSKSEDASKDAAVNSNTAANDNTVGADAAKEAITNLEKAAGAANTEVEEFFDEEDEDSSDSE